MGRYGQSTASAHQPARPAARPAPKAAAPSRQAASQAVPVLHHADPQPLARSRSWGPKRAMSRTDTVEIAVQLGVMLDAGVPLTQALDGLQAQAGKPHVRDAMQAVLEDVRSGSDLSTAVARCPYPFPPIFSQLLRAAEATGAMGPTLARAADYLQSEVDTIRRVRAALAYPAVMMFLGLVAMVVIFGFLLPRFEVMYAGRQAMLPLPTKIALGISHFLRAHWILLASTASVLIVAIVLYFRSSHGRMMIDWLKLHCPLINRMFRQLYVSRSFQTMGAMIQAGVTVPEAVRLSRDVAGNRYFVQLWDLAGANLQAGKRLADPLFATNLVSKTVAQLVATGERSGNLAIVMQKIAALCERELQHTIKTVTSLLEPLMIVILGGMVGGIVMTILLPVFRIARSVGGH